MKQIFLLKLLGKFSYEVKLPVTLITGNKVKFIDLQNN